MKRSRILSSLILLMISTHPSSARIWHVSADGTGDAATIQLAIAMAYAGDVIQVGPGIYNENLSLRDGLEILSDMGPEATIVDGGQLGSVVSSSGIMYRTRLSGFTLRNGRAQLGGGIRCIASILTIENNIIRDCSTYGTSYGGGIYTSQCPPENVIQDNRILDNHAYIGGGICCNGEDESTVVRNTIFSNESTHAGGIISYNRSAITIEGNLITHNSAGSGGGIYVHSSSSAVIGCNDVWSNEGGDYHGSGEIFGIDGNFSLDPIYCDPVSEDLSLADTSPCLPGNHPQGEDCGRIGALGMGCEGPTPIQQTTWGRIRAGFH